MRSNWIGTKTEVLILGFCSWNGRAGRLDFSLEQTLMMECPPEYSQKSPLRIRLEFS